MAQNVHWQLDKHQLIKDEIFLVAQQYRLTAYGARAFSQAAEFPVEQTPQALSDFDHHGKNVKRP